MGNKWWKTVVVVCFVVSLLWVPCLWAKTQAGVKGVAHQVINSGGYTYVEVNSNKGLIWVALPPVPVKKGDKVEVDPGEAMVMSDFKSRSLNRVFREILFAPRIRINGRWQPSEGGSSGASGSMGGMASSGMAPSFQLPGERSTSTQRGGGSSFHGAPHGGAGFQVSFPPPGSIKPPRGGYTVAQLYGKAKELNGRGVVVRGKVIKFLPGIMGKNWIHIADGSGENGRAEVTVTTQAVVKPGDVVVVKGKLSSNKDFGYGYFYKVIVEDAQVKVEK